MKPIYFAVLLSLMPQAARAQVFINQAALDQLAGVQAPVPAVGVAPVASKPVAHRHVMAHVVAVVSKPMAPAPLIKTAPAPMVQPAMVQPAPVMAAPAKPAAPVMIAFPAGGTDLPAAAAALLQPICTRAGEGGLVTVDAYAAANGSDVSAPMRTSLTRAFAVRDALTACGVPAAHIIPRADGAVAGKDPESAMVSLGVASTGQNK